MRTDQRRWGVCAVGVALVLAAAWITPASGADKLKDDAAALAELRALLTFTPRPKTLAEAMAKFREVMPKLEALAEKYKDAEKAGPQALYVIGMISMRLEDTKKAKAAFTKFLKRYPDHAAKGQVKSQLDKLNAVGNAAKEFQTQDLAGKAVKLSDFRGKVVLLDFFAGWCPPCRAEMPNLVKLYAKYKGRGFEIVGISMDRGLDKAKAYVKRAGITWTVVFEKPGGWNNPVAKLYGIRSIPATYLLDKEGKILRMGLRGKALEAELAKLLPDKAAPK